MPGSIALVAAALLAQAPPAPVAPPEAAPAPVAAAAPQQLGAPARAGDLWIELGLASAPAPAPGELDVEATAGVEYVPWRLGPVRAGLRVGALLAGATTCDAGGVDCSFAGAYAGALARFAPLEDGPVSPWLAFGVTGLLASGLDSDDSRLAAVELARLSAGVDVLVTAWRVRLGVFGFWSETAFSASPAPLADGRAAMWGAGLRLQLGARPPAAHAL